MRTTSRTGERSRLPLGAHPSTDGVDFCVFAPYAKQVWVELEGTTASPVLLARDVDGYHLGHVRPAGPGSRYKYRLDDKGALPDPASRSQPEGVHGPSEVIDLEFDWHDQRWRGASLTDAVLYELHVGTFTERGDFLGVEAELERLRDLGITAIEIMPVAQFPGSRNWGYDGVFPFAAQQSYGGATGLAHLVDRCHQLELAVVLDVVYNHLGPEGNYLGSFGPYFTDTYKTPWGPALNFDGPGSDAVRRYFIENALYWLRDLHLDGLRLDAVHAIYDSAAFPFLEELSESVAELSATLGRRLWLIAESDRNDPRLVAPRSLGGYALDSMWCDDFHHGLHHLLTGERSGYYHDFSGIDDLARAWRTGLTYSGQYSPHRQRRHGRSGRFERHQVVIASQNHDQIGNRMLGERLLTLAGLEKAKLAALAVLLAPWIPLLFMGEENAETVPFLYFVSHGDPSLTEAVRRGRAEEFSAFSWQGTPPDPASEETFFRSRVSGTHPDAPAMSHLYRHLIQLRKELVPTEPDQVERTAPETLLIRRGDRACFLLHFSDRACSLPVALEPGSWRVALATAAIQWNGPGHPGPGLIEVTPSEPAKLELVPWSALVLIREPSASDAIGDC